MIRYRCPHCSSPLLAHERRIAQSSVCKACVKPHPIPTDQSQWLNERGESLHPPAGRVAEQVMSASVPAAEPKSSPESQPETVILPPTKPAIELPPEID